MRAGGGKVKRNSQETLQKVKISRGLCVCVCVKVGIFYILVG